MSKKIAGKKKQQKSELFFLLRELSALTQKLTLWSLALGEEFRKFYVKRFYMAGGSLLAFGLTFMSHALLLAKRASHILSTLMLILMCSSC